MLGLSVASTYSDVVIGVFEQMAQMRGIERFKVRKYEDFLREINETDALEKCSDDLIIRSIAHAVNLTPKRLKKAVISKAGEEFLKVLK